MTRKPYPGAPTTRHFRVQDSPAHATRPWPFRQHQLTDIATVIEGLSPAAQYLIAIGLTLLVVSADAFTDPQLSFSIFYLMPIAMLAWHRGWGSARFAVFATTAVWFIADYFTGPVYSSPAIRWWNVGVRFAFFFVSGYIVSQLRRAVNEEQRLARTDSLTGVANSRAFLENAAREVARQQRYRHPISVAYVDCDNFKDINDRFGHAAGDELLRTIALCIEGSLRTIDVVARLGGDEFAVLLPESDAQGAHIVCVKIREALKLAVVKYNVTFSIGLVTYVAPPANVEDLLHAADHAMYDAKKTGKNSSRHRVIGEALQEGTHGE